MIKELSEQTQAVSINPLKVAPGLGAGFAAQGFYKAMPFFHSAPGCSFLSKVMLTQHFMEPIAASGSDIKETALIFGGTKELEVTVTKFCQKSKPEIIFILSSSIPEIRGEIYLDCIVKLERSFPDIEFIVIPTPDFQGGFSEGFSRLVYGALDKLAEGGVKIDRQVNLLPAPYMTAGDIDELREITESFGLIANVIPDMSQGPDGSKESFSSMSVAGTTLGQLKNAGRSTATISFGAVMKESGDLLQEKFGVPHFSVDSVCGLMQTDNFIQNLMQLSPGTEIAHKYKKQRARLKDIMIDTHLLMNNKNVAIALDYDHAHALQEMLKDVGVDSCAIAPFAFKSKDKEGIVQQGTLYDIENKVILGEHFDALISNTHGKELSEKYSIPLIRMGFPVSDRYGYNYEVSVGYSGAIALISTLANVLMEKVGHKPGETGDIDFKDEK